MRLENDLRGALERHEFILNFQPIISLKTNKIAGFESLVRWQHPERGIISPEIFIPIAEETGVILLLGKWILIESCRQLKLWIDRIPEPLFVSVNVSGKQFMEQNFVSIVKNALEETGLPGHCLKLEMTESVLIGNVEELAIMLRQIREMGIRIAIDDFGPFFCPADVRQGQKEHYRNHCFYGASAEYGNRCRRRGNQQSFSLSERLWL